MKVLLIGAGGREHALAWKISTSPVLTKLFAAPGNPGIAACAEIAGLDVDDHEAVTAFCLAKTIDLVVVGPEVPLVAGIADRLREAGIAVFGPSAQAARLEGSKSFTKELCDRFNIPTAAYEKFNNAPKAKAYIRQQGAPIVIKADGLAAGKGVTVAMTLEDAFSAIDDCFEGAFGDAGAEVVVEEFLVGEEASFFCLADGQTALALTTAQDHKAVGEGDTGPNTGGMGAYSPANVMTPERVDTTMTTIIAPTLNGLREMGTPFQGVLFAGLMITEQGPKLIEYNVRFGDPECQVLMMRMKSDVLPLLKASADGALANMSTDWRDEAALTVVMAAHGYPGSYKKGSIISGIAEAETDADVKVFHAGTRVEMGQLTANGGRVLNVTALGQNVKDAQHSAYQAVDRIGWPDGFCRRDIGWRAVSGEK